MKGMAFHLPVRPAFIEEILEDFLRFTSMNPDAAGSMVLWEFQDPIQLVRSEAGSFANRGYHFNAATFPMWNDAKLDRICRQFARDVSTKFRTEIGASQAPKGNTITADGTVTNDHGGMLVYGNYDVSDLFCISWTTGTNMKTSNMMRELGISLATITKS
jgi:hypothetical protein